MAANSEYLQAHPATVHQHQWFVGVGLTVSDPKEAVPVQEPQTAPFLTDDPDPTINPHPLEHQALVNPRSEMGRRSVLQLGTMAADTALAAFAPPQ